MENFKNLILEHLRAIRTNIGAIKDDVRELKLRVENLEVGQATMMQHLGHHASVSAKQHLSYDRIVERLEKLEAAWNWRTERGLPEPTRGSRTCQPDTWGDGNCKRSTFRRLSLRTRSAIHGPDCMDAGSSPA